MRPRLFASDVVRVGAELLLVDLASMRPRLFASDVGL